jgi:hypothetical protein
MIPNRRLKDNAKASVDGRPTGKNHFNVLKASVRALPVFATCLPLRDATELTAPSIRKNAANPNPEWGENAIKHCAAAGFGCVGSFVTALQHTGWRRRSTFLSIRWEQMAEIRVQREQFTPKHGTSP